MKKNKKLLVKEKSKNRIIEMLLESRQELYAKLLVIRSKLDEIDAIVASVVPK